MVLTEDVLTYKLHGLGNSTKNKIEILQRIAFHKSKRVVIRELIIYAVVSI